VEWLLSINCFYVLLIDATINFRQEGSSMKGLKGLLFTCSYSERKAQGWDWEALSFGHSVLIDVSLVILTHKAGGTVSILSQRV